MIAFREKIATLVLVLSFLPPFPPINDPIPIEDPNQRSVLVAPGESVTYVVVLSRPLIITVQMAEPEWKDGFEKRYSCRTTVRWGGTSVPAAHLTNNAELHFYQDKPRVPARIDGIDLNGTEARVIGWRWSGLSQTANPSIGARFNSSGRVTAQGTITECWNSWMCRNMVVVSRMYINWRGVSCQ